MLLKNWIADRYNIQFSANEWECYKQCKDAKIEFSNQRLHYTESEWESVYIHWLKTGEVLMQHGSVFSDLGLIASYGGVVFTEGG